MGAYDGAEICELVGCFILSEIAKKSCTVMWDYIVMTNLLFSRTQKKKAIQIP